MGRNRLLVAIALLAGCGAPAVSLPVPDPARAPVTVALTTTTTEAPPTTTTSTTLAEGESATTLPEPVQPDLPVDEIPFAVAAVEGARGGPFRLWSLDVVPGAIEVSVADDVVGQVGYRWSDGRLEGPLEATPPPSGTVAFRSSAVDVQAARRGFEFVDTFVQGVGVQSVLALSPRGSGVLWIVSAVHSDFSPVTAVFDASGDLQALNG